MIDYGPFPELAGFYLEDSYVLKITETANRVTFILDAVLTPQHPDYHPPNAGEHHCYHAADLIFEGLTKTAWLRRSNTVFIDAAGDHDMGNIDILAADGNSIVLEGDWGRVQLWGHPPNSRPHPRIALRR